MQRYSPPFAMKPLSEMWSNHLTFQVPLINGYHKVHQYAVSCDLSYVNINTIHLFRKTPSAPLSKQHENKEKIRIHI